MAGIGSGLDAADGVPHDYDRSNAGHSREPASRDPDDIINHWRSFRENIRHNVSKIGEIKGDSSGYKADVNLGLSSKSAASQNTFLKSTPLQKESYAHKLAMLRKQ